MTTVYFIALLILALGLPFSAWSMIQLPPGSTALKVDTAAATSGPVKLDVRAQLAGMLPEVERFRVYCDITDEKGAQILFGFSPYQPLASGGFSGTVPVWLNYVTGRSSLEPKAQYLCNLILFPSGQVPAWGELGSGRVDRPASDEKLEWQKRRPGTPYVGVIRGAFPPPQSAAIDQIQLQQKPAQQDTGSPQVLQMQQQLEQARQLLKELNERQTPIDKLVR